MADENASAPKDFENVQQAIANLQVSVDARLRSHGSDDVIVKRKQKEIERLKSKQEIAVKESEAAAPQNS
jgi:hypothetical protein